MRLSRVKIKNYRSIQECEFYPGNICAMVGENNAGKSNILRAIYSVIGRDWVSANSFSDDDFTDHNPDNDITIELEFDPPLTYQGFVAENSVDVPIVRYVVTHYKRSTKQAKAGDRRLETACLQANGDLVSVLAEAPQHGKQHKYKTLTSIPAEIREQMPVLFIGTDRSLSTQLPSVRTSLLRRMLEDVDKALKKKTAQVEENGVIRERFVHDIFLEKLRSALDTLRVPEFQELENILRIRSLENLGYDPVKDKEKFRFHFDLFDSMDFFKAIKIRFQEGTFEIEATSMGEGAQNAFVIAVFQAYEQMRKKGSVFLIEEPEMYLHPHRQRFFYQTLRNISENNQIIYTTHSANFVTVPEYEEIHLVSRGENGYTKITRSSLKMSDAEREKLRKELDPERNELFFSRYVILVEGDTEKLALPEYAVRLSIDLNRVGCSIIEVGGKRSLKALASMVRSFKIPFTIVFDTDSSDSRKDKKNEEQEYNNEINAFQSENISVIELNPNYEALLRSSMGDELYERLCQKYPSHSKAIRARLIAADEEAPVPDFVKKIYTPF